MTNEEMNLEKYKVAREHLTFEAQFLWTIFSSFLLVHTILLGFIIQNAFKDNNIFGYNFVCFISSVIGTVLMLPWYGTFRRSSGFYDLRMAQSRVSEPSDWKLLATTGQDFAEGKGVKVGTEEKEHKLDWWGVALRTKNSIRLLMLIFFLIYLFIIASTGPWWNPIVADDKCCCKQLQNMSIKLDDISKTKPDAKSIVVTADSIN